MADPNELHRIVLCRMGNSNNFHSIPVIAKDEYSFFIASGRGRIDLKDEDLKPNEEGKYVIDLEPLDLKFFYANVDLPKSFEMPLEVLEARKEKRRIKALEKDAVFIDRSGPEPMYFYVEGEKLRILQGDKEALATKIEKIHNRLAVNVEALELQHPYLELPGDVARKFENVLQEKELRSLALVPAGRSLLNGCEYFRLNMEVPASMWSQVNGVFEDWGEPDGWVTCEPSRVSEILHIPIE